MGPCVSGAEYYSQRRKIVSVMPDAAWSKVYCVIVLFNRMKAEARKQQVSKRLKMQASY